MQTADLSPHLYARHSRHDDIGEDHVKAIGVAGHLLQPLDPIGCKHSSEAELIKRVTRAGGNLGIVFHDQDAGARHGRFDRARDFGGRVPHGRSDTGKVEREASSGSHDALDLDLAARLARKAEHLRKAEPRSGSHRFLREEWLEDTLALVGRNAGSGVLDGYRDKSAWRFRPLAYCGNSLGAAQADGKPAIALHRVARIQGQVDERGVELIGVNVDAKGFGDVQDDLDPDALIACLTDDVRFENVSNSGQSLVTTSKAAFADLARQSAEAFHEREQSVRRTVVGDDAVAVEIDYRAKLAADLPNGMKAGDVLQLRGVSFFKLRDGRIAEIVDFS